jgi:alkylation response protein AidB-like acyl-CoA dehydrogenase
MRVRAGWARLPEGPMIDFSLTDEQWALRELAHDFAAKEIRPVAWEYDREATWPQAIIEQAWEVGLMNAHIPEAYGGAGASFIDGVLIAEELGWGCSGIGTSISCNGLASAPVLLGGSEQVKQTYSAVLLDQGKRNTIESSHAKRFAADTAMEVTTDAVQVYGGYGFMKHYPVEKLMRDAKIMQLYEGTSQIQRLVIARKTLLPRPAAALAHAAA